MRIVKVTRRRLFGRPTSLNLGYKVEVRTMTAIEKGVIECIKEGMEFNCIHYTEFDTPYDNDIVGILAVE